MERNINRLTSTDAVKKAIAECDKLGRENFLDKYGYKRARKYPLVFNGQEYDSKAIAGVAFGKQYGTPLTAYEFSGGVERCVPVLKKLGFEIRGVVEANAAGRASESGVKNPKWSRDELMLALHLYLHNRRSPPGKNSAPVAELSQLLNQMNPASGATNYRNPTGVYMKLMNFRGIDPVYTAEGKRGLTRGSKDDQVVWDLFAHRLPHLDTAVASLKAIIAGERKDSGIDEPDEPAIEDCEEGRVFTRLHRYRERNRKLVADFKARSLKKHGELRCGGCDTDFAVKYGAMAERLIDVHHTKPIHTMKPGDKTDPKDLVLLCVSCHRAVHSEKQWLSVDELRLRLGKPSAA